MKQQYAFLLWGLLLLAGCEKKDPEPAFIGRWDWVQSQTSNYTQAGELAYSDPPSAPAVYGAQHLAVSVDSLNTHTRNGIIRQGYRRHKQVLTLTSGNGREYTLHIQELTDNRLVVTYAEYYPASSGGKVARQTLSEYLR